MRYRRFTIGVLAVAVGAVGLIGIGTASASTTGAVAKGSPVVVNINFGRTGSITFPQVDAAIHAAAKAINKSGGINGRPLTISICDGKTPTDPTPSIACTKAAVANNAVVAEVGDYTSFGDQITPILNDGGVTNIGPVPLSSAQLSLPNSYPLMGSEGGGLGVLMADHGAKTIGEAYVDIPAGAGSIAFANIFLGKGRNGQKVDATVPISLTATDVTPQVATLKDMDGVALSLAPTQVAQYITAWKQAGYKQILGAPALAMLPTELKTLGSTANGVYIVSGLPIITSNNPGVKMFKAEMKAYDSKASLDTTSLNAWMSVWAFAKVARTIQGDVTRKSVAQAWASLGAFDLFGMLPAQLNFQNHPVGIASLDRVFNVWVQYGQVKNGTIVDLKKGWVSLVVPPKA
jgi:branched-chain amino acid transport system substrate-binding protein